jgi:hypothetical protein
VKSGDWIALASALLLAVAALAAWRAYGLAAEEHREARDEARKAPLRGLVSDVVRELKELAAQAEERVPAVGNQRIDLIAGQQRRLAIALTFVPPDVFNLFATRDLAEGSVQEVTADRVRVATQELLRLFAEIEAGHYSIRQVALPAQRADPGFGATGVKADLEPPAGRLTRGWRCLVGLVQRSDQRV